MSIRIVELSAAAGPAIRPMDPGGFTLVQGGFQCPALGTSVVPFSKLRGLSIFTSRPDEGAGTYLLLVVEGLAYPLMTAADRLDFDAMGVPAHTQVVERLRLLGRYFSHHAPDVATDRGTYEFLRESPAPTLSGGVAQYLAAFIHAVAPPPEPAPAQPAPMPTRAPEAAPAPHQPAALDAQPTPAAPLPVQHQQQATPPTQPTPAAPLPAQHQQQAAPPAQPAPAAPLPVQHQQQAAPPTQPAPAAPLPTQHQQQAAPPTQPTPATPLPAQHQHQAAQPAQPAPAAPLPAQHQQQAAPPAQSTPAVPLPAQHQQQAAPPAQTAPASPIPTEPRHHTPAAPAALAANTAPAQPAFAQPDVPPPVPPEPGQALPPGYSDFPDPPAIPSARSSIAEEPAPQLPSHVAAAPALATPPLGAAATAPMAPGAAEPDLIDAPPPPLPALSASVPAIPGASPAATTAGPARPEDSPPEPPTGPNPGPPSLPPSAGSGGTGGGAPPNPGTPPPLPLARQQTNTEETPDLPAIPPSPTMTTAKPPDTRNSEELSPLPMPAAEPTRGSWLSYPLRGWSFAYMIACAVFGIALFALASSLVEGGIGSAAAVASLPSLGLDPSSFSTVGSTMGLIAILGLLFCTAPFSHLVMLRSAVGEDSLLSLPAYRRFAERSKEVGVSLLLLGIFTLPLQGFGLLLEPIIRANRHPGHLVSALAAAVFAQLVLGGLVLLAHGSAGAYGKPRLSLRFDHHAKAFLMATGGVSAALLRMFLAAFVGIAAYFALLLLPGLIIDLPSWSIAALTGALAGYLLLSGSRITGLLFRRNAHLLDPIYEPLSAS